MNLLVFGYGSLLYKPVPHVCYRSFLCYYLTLDSTLVAIPDTSKALLDVSRNRATTIEVHQPAPGVLLPLYTATNGKTTLKVTRAVPRMLSQRTIKSGVSYTKSHRSIHSPSKHISITVKRTDTQKSV